MTPLRSLPALTAMAIAAMACMVSGCKDENPVETADIGAGSVPTMVTHDVQTLISDSGVVRYKITTPVWYVYDEIKDPCWRFPEGLELEKYNDLFQRDATVRADSATYFKNKQLWRLDGGVSVSNVAGEKFLTEQLYWDQRQHKLYSDSFIHIERADRVLEGYGFDSDERLTRYTIRRVSGIFPAGQFQPGQGQRRSAAADTSATAADTVSGSTSRQ